MENMFTIMNLTWRSPAQCGAAVLTSLLSWKCEMSQVQRAAITVKLARAPVTPAAVLATVCPRLWAPDQ